MNNIYKSIKICSSLFNLIRKTDGCSVKLGLQVVYVSGQKYKGNNEDTNEDRGGLVCLGSNLSDNTIFTNDFNAGDVITCVVVSF
mmetsp:Transcript_53645/g.59966  ORF Transcript_53645/g.59966 Transcript_53645/m.59966 type:complete len:85 (-) Transcript_53645:1174-1428(-)